MLLPFAGHDAVPKLPCSGSAAGQQKRPGGTGPPGRERAASVFGRFVRARRRGRRNLLSEAVPGGVRLESGPSDSCLCCLLFLGLAAVESHSTLLSLGQSGGTQAANAAAAACLQILVRAAARVGRGSTAVLLRMSRTVHELTQIACRAQPPRPSCAVHTSAVLSHCDASTTPSRPPVHGLTARRRANLFSLHQSNR
jgi:hypothetical protein